MTTEIKVETNIPLPTARMRNGAWTTLLKSLKVKDSFLVPASKAQGVYVAAKKAKVKVTQSKEKTGVRFWRLE